MKKPLFYISCPYDTYSGYGARSRDIIKSIVETNEYEVKIVPQRWGETPWGFCDDHEEWKFLHDLILPPSHNNKRPNIWMQITIPNEFQAAGDYNIGVTAGIEATVCKPEWIQGVNRMNETWVSSKFSKQVFEQAKFNQQNSQTGQNMGTLQAEKPIKVVFEGAKLDVYKKYNNGPKFDLKDIKENFCFLFVGHWLQGSIGEDRKNVGLMLKTFLETFKNKSKRPALVMKTMSGPASIMDREEILKRIDAIRKGVSGTLPNVYLLHGEIEDEDMNHLYNHPKIKAMISLTKGEGFGRPLLEFTQSKKPVIASNWSGHLDFLNSEFASLVPGELKEIHSSAVQKDLLIEKSKWFSPDINFVSLLLKDYVNGYKQYQVNGKRLGYYCKTNFSFDIMQKKLEEVLDKNAPKKVEIKLPNIKKISLPKKDV